MKCKYCDREFKNSHGLHIHWFYCLPKGFSEMEIVKVPPSGYRELIGDSFLIPLFRIPRNCLKFFVDGEFGMKYNKRYVLGELDEK